MNATLAQSGAPARHLKCWSDGTRIYVEIPGSGDKPAYITSYDYNYRGIDMMLSLLGAHRVDYDYQGTIPPGYTGRSNFDVGTETQRAQAQKTLRAMGIIK